jgi:hypothetical protein
MEISTLLQKAAECQHPFTIQNVQMSHASQPLLGKSFDQTMAVLTEMMNNKLKTDLHA